MLKKRTATQAGATLLAMGLVLTACASERGTADVELDETDPAVAEWAEGVREMHEGTTITVAAHTHPSTDAMQTMTSQFEELTGIEVVWDVVEQNTLKQKIELELQAQNAAYVATTV